jgi:hypothetical protein
VPADRASATRGFAAKKPCAQLIQNPKLRKTREERATMPISPAKRQRERNRQERRREKELRRAVRRTEKLARTTDSGVDRDIVGVVPGPQPLEGP